MSESYTYDRNTQRYRSANGKFLSAAKVKTITEETIAFSTSRVQAIGDDLISDKISLREWAYTTAKELKTLHLQQYMLGRGGAAAMTNRDNGLVGATLKDEYKFLKQFQRDIKKGDLSIEQFKARLDLYVASSQSSYEMGRRESHKADGFTLEKRIKTAAESCADCIGYAAQSWQPIGTLPSIGADCQCKANCKCYFEYSRNQPDRMLYQRFGWLPDRGLRSIDRLI